jgi:PAS domain S-box-containing protein
VRRRLLVWMLLPSLAAVLGLGLAAGWSQRESARVRQAVAAQAAAFLVADYVAEADNDLRHSVLHMFSDPAHTAPEVMGVIRSSFRQFERLFALDADGRVLAADPPVPAGSSFPLGHLAPAEGGLLRPSLSPFTGLPAVYVSQRSADGRVLVGELSLSALQGHLSRLAALSPGEEMALTDAAGNVLAHPNLALVETRANLGHLNILRRAREGGVQFADYVDRGTRRIGAAIRAPETGWLLLVDQPALGVYGPIAILVLTLSTLLAGLFFLLAFLTERTLQLQVVAPLAGFAAAISDIGRGQMQGALPPREGFRELSLLVDEFNAARGALAVRDAALRASEAKYRDIFENAVEGLFQSTPAGRYVSANPALARILGYGSPGELMAEMTDLRTQLYADPADRDEFLRLLAEYGEVKGFESVYRRRDGSTRWCSVSARALRDSLGQVSLIEGAVEDVTERKQAEQKLRDSLREKEVLLKEVHHRVKNNLQVVSGLLYLQADSLEDPAARAALAESQNRIASMALAHEALYGSDDLARVDLKDYVDRLMARLGSSLGDRSVQIAVEVSTVPLPLTKAIPCGLILNELVTNALKYAFAGPGGRITVATRRVGDRVELSVADNGRGLPAHITPQTATTLGLQLVANLTGQLKGGLRIDRENGTLFTIDFPLEDEWPTS